MKMKTTHVRTKLRKYPIYIESNLTRNFLNLVRKHFKDFNKLIFVTNDKVYSIYGDRLKKILDSDDLDYELIILKDGEEYKNLDSANFIYKKLIELNTHRNDILVAFGGGVIGDLVGFVASTFHRGVRLIQYPTTIIGQVDSSIGGKVVVNYNSIKNIIGNFYQPHMIIMDPVLLCTLDEVQIINGLAEVVKYGVVFDRNILEILNKNIDVNRQDRLFLLIKSNIFEEIIYRCCYIKSRVVEKDEFDTGYRNLLNFGHTIGHCIENATDLKYINHGRAVSMGMIVAIDISIGLGLAKKTLKEKVLGIYKKLKLPRTIPKLDIDKIMDALKYDKKFTSTKNKFILLKGLNRPIFCYNVNNNIIIESLEKNMD